MAKSVDLLDALPPPFRFIEVTLTDDDLRVAAARAKDLGALRNSIRGGEGNMVGYLGEIAVTRGLQEAGHEVQWADTFDYDLVASGIKIDVKTKECTSAPLGRYDASVCRANTTQRCDLYAFVRVKGNRAWIAGTMAPKDYYAQARALRKGEWDPSNDWTAKWDCYNVPYERMDQRLFR